MSEVSKEVVTRESSSPAEMIQMAVDNGADLDKLEKLLSLQERWEANEAKKAYNVSMAIVHGKIKSVLKNKNNPQTHSKYADLDSVITQTKDAYTGEGFSVSFYEGENPYEDCVKVCADVTHSKGHTITRCYNVPLDGVGIKGNANMTKIHAKGSSTSYGRRYLLCMIFNIPTTDDVDGAQKTQTQDFNIKKEVLAKAKKKFKDTKSFDAWRDKNKFLPVSKCTDAQLSSMLDMLVSDE